jgi:hypothetical protein
MSQPDKTHEMELEQYDISQGDFDSSLRAEYDRQRQNEEETGNTSIRSPEMEMMPSESWYTAPSFSDYKMYTDNTSA